MQITNKHQYLNLNDQNCCHTQKSFEFRILIIGIYLRFAILCLLFTVNPVSHFLQRSHDIKILHKHIFRGAETDGGKVEDAFDACAGKYLANGNSIIGGDGEDCDGDFILFG